MQIIHKRKIYFSISGALVGFSIIALLVFGLKPGIDFTGGSLLEIQVKEGLSLTAGQISDLLTKGESPILPSVAAQSAENNGFILRFKDTSEDDHQKIIAVLRQELAKQESPAGEKDENKEENKDQADEPAPIGVSAVDGSGKPVNIQVQPEPLAESGVITIGGQDLIVEKSFQSIGPIVG